MNPVNKIALVHDTDARKNIGCRLTSSLLKRNLLEVLEGLGINSMIQSVPWPFPSRTLFQDLGFLMRGCSSEKGIQKLATFEYGVGAVADIQTSDLVVFQPEGRIAKNDRPEKILRLFSLPLYAACVLKKKVLVLNGSLTSRSDENFHFINEMLKAFHFVSGRDRHSAEAYGVEFIPDAAFCWKPITVNSRPLMSRDFILISTAAGSTAKENLDSCRKALDICASLNKRPLILTKAHEHLRPLNGEVLSMRGKIIDYADLSYADHLINECAFHFGARYHMAILSACLGVPSYLAETNSHKNEWLVEDVYGIQKFPQCPPADILIQISRFEPDRIRASSNSLAKLHRSKLISAISTATVEEFCPPNNILGHVLSKQSLSKVRKDSGLRIGQRFSRRFPSLTKWSAPKLI